jgi:hypothetical protein
MLDRHLGVGTKAVILGHQIEFRMQVSPLPSTPLCDVARYEVPETRIAGLSLDVRRTDRITMPGLAGWAEILCYDFKRRRLPR